MKMDVADLAVWNFTDFCEYWDTGADKDDFIKGESILKFELGSRGEAELVEVVEVVDNKFEVRDTQDIMDWITAQGGDEDEMEFAAAGIEEWFNGAEGELLTVYGETVFEELGFVYVRLYV